MATNSELYAILRNDLVAFVEKVFQTLNPGQGTVRAKSLEPGRAVS